MWCSRSQDETEDAWNLYQHIEQVEGLNVADGFQDLRCIFKPFARRRDPLPSVTSNGDGELILKVWFSSPVTIRQLCIASCGAHGGADGAPDAATGPSDGDGTAVSGVADHAVGGGRPPTAVRCFTGTAAEELDFPGIDDLQPSQTMELPPNPKADVATPCSMKHFNQVTFALFHFKSRVDAGAMRISYFGLQGTHSHASRHAIDAKYEVLHCPNDVQAKDERAAGGDKFDGL